MNLSKMHCPENCYFEPEFYKKYFRAFYWNISRYDERNPKRLKDKGKRKKLLTQICSLNSPMLLSNPSQFAVFASIRNTVVTKWMHMIFSSAEFSYDSDDSEYLFANSTYHPPAKLSKMIDIGLRTVFTLVSQSRAIDPMFCDHALRSLLNILQGHSPEDLSLEQAEVINNLHAMLIEVSGGSSQSSHIEIPAELTSSASSCLLALSVGRGLTENILSAIASLIMSPQILIEHNIAVPDNLVTLQKSVQSVLYGSLARNTWLNFGVPSQSFVSSFTITMPTELTSAYGNLTVKSMAADGAYLYIYTSKGLLTYGTGYGNTIPMKLYSFTGDFFRDRYGWLGYCKDVLYIKLGKKKYELLQLNKYTLQINCSVNLEPPLEYGHSVLFCDGTNLGVISLTAEESFTVRLYRSDDITRAAGIPVTPTHVFPLHLSRKRMLILGWASFEEPRKKRILEPMDLQAFSQYDENFEEDDINSMVAGEEFALLLTSNGKVYYSGKSMSLGYRVPSPNNCKWTFMKDTITVKGDILNVKKAKIVQIAIGHEGGHAILVAEDGTAYFAGTARRGEDGDCSKYRRQPKPSRPKRIHRVDSHHIVYAACNYGSTALLTNTGLTLMFGKDTQFCDSSGVVTALKNETIVQIALGKAHAVALNNKGQVFTFGLNNKGQCGRELGYSKERPMARSNYSSSNVYSSHQTFKVCGQGDHMWEYKDCMICTLCHQCTGFSTECKHSKQPNRLPKQKCGCGEGDSGCKVCNICRKCSLALSSAGNKVDVDAEASSSNQEAVAQCSKDSNAVYCITEDNYLPSEEKESAVRVNCLSPGKLALPGGQKIICVATGLHHTVLLTEHGEVLTFGANQFGQLGVGDIAMHNRVIRVKVRGAVQIAAGSNHTVILTAQGEVFTMGSYQKGSLGRQRVEGIPDRAVWYAVPGKVHRLGPNHACRAAWISASGEQTFISLNQSLIKTETLFTSTVTANKNTIVVLPNKKEHTYKCLTINKHDGHCYTYTGPEQVDFVNSLSCIDSLYDILWTYQPHTRVVKNYNIIKFDTHKLQKCYMKKQFENSYTGIEALEYPNYGPMKRLEDFKNFDTSNFMTTHYDIHKSHNDECKPISILDPAIAIPCTTGCYITRMHASVHLLACLDWLNYAQDNRLQPVECKREFNTSNIMPSNEDFVIVNRFESHGGGWGYSGHSVEAIRFSCDTDCSLGGFQLFGGRGDYTAKVKLFDLGPDGGEQEGDGELIVETEEITYECAPREKYSIMFDIPIHIIANRWYLAWACINGPSSDCGSSGQSLVLSDEVVFHFKTSKKSNNGTDVNAGQIPGLLYSVITPEHIIMSRANNSLEPVVTLSRAFSKKVSSNCFNSLVSLLQWSWNMFKVSLLDVQNQAEFKWLMTMRNQRVYSYIICASLRLIKSFVNEIFPKNIRKRNYSEFGSYIEILTDVRNLLQKIMADNSIGSIMKKSKKEKADCINIMDMIDQVLKESHSVVTNCFHAFYLTPQLKWNHLCRLIASAKGGELPRQFVRELSGTVTALCVSNNLRDVLQYVMPTTEKHYINKFLARKRSLFEVEFGESVMESCDENMSLKSLSTSSRHPSKPPPIPPRTHSSKDSSTSKMHTQTPMKDTDWTLIDILTPLLDIINYPLKRQIDKTVQADDQEILLDESLSKHCAMFMARIVAELAQYAAKGKQDYEQKNSTNYMISPSRFMRMNQSRTWNTGNGSPDAICFTVDKPYIFIVGVGVYGGVGNYDYELEILHEVKVRGSTDANNATYCWYSIEVVHGMFSAADCHNDIAQLKFDRAIPLKENVRYALRFCNHGNLTANGDCGLPAVKGPDGTTFRFSSCSLSFNGTTLARGQIPYIIYYSTSPLSKNNQINDSEITSNAVRCLTLDLATLILDLCSEIFRNIRSKLNDDEQKRIVGVLQSSPYVNILIPYVLTHLQGLTDIKSSVQIMEVIYRLLPHVAELNQLTPACEDERGTSCIQNTTSRYYIWVESDHPYKQATISNYRVKFPPSITWMVVEFDPKSGTEQPEDSLTVFSSMPSLNNKNHCHCRSSLTKAGLNPLHHLPGNTSESSLLEESLMESTCLEYNCCYFAVTPKMTNNSTDWPQKALVVPGNEVIFSLETASPYVSEIKGNCYGFGAMVVGYEDANLPIIKYGLNALEMELAFTASSSAARLLSPDVEIPLFGTASSIDMSPDNEEDFSSEEPEKKELFENNKAFLLSKGLELSAQPSIGQIVDGEVLDKLPSSEKVFLNDFIKMVEGTAGGRLAKWLQPDSIVEPSKCELRVPSGLLKVGSPVNITVFLKDQYGDTVKSPQLRVEVIVQINEPDSSRKRGENSSHNPTYGGREPPSSKTPYELISKDNMRYHTITMMKQFAQYSFEEIRLAGPSSTKKHRMPPERIQVKLCLDGSYSGSWYPKTSGFYTVQCTLDDKPAQEIEIEIREPGSYNDAPQPSKGKVIAKISKKRRFAIKHTAGLRVRVHPSLQSEQIAIIPSNTDITITEECQNSDGIWVRISEDSVREYLSDSEPSCLAATALVSAPPDAWCVQYHQPLEKTLLVVHEDQSDDKSEPDEPWYASFGRQTDSDDTDSTPDSDDNSYRDSTIPYINESNRDDDGSEEDEEDKDAFTRVGSIESPLNETPMVFSSPENKHVNESECSQGDKSNVSPRLFNGNKTWEEWNPKEEDTILVEYVDGEGGEKCDPKIISEPEEEQSHPRTMQAGTQTSPSCDFKELFSKLKGTLTKGDPKNENPPKDLPDKKPSVTRPFPTASKPLPTTHGNTKPVRRKPALSPTQAECIRAVFAALLWHEGIVQDAITCAVFLKFHPFLPKTGFKIITEAGSSNKINEAQNQRHSVEISSGRYVEIQECCLESMTKSALNASRTRAKRYSGSPGIGDIQEEDTTPTSTAEEVGALPPVLRALVALWDVLCSSNLHNPPTKTFRSRFEKKPSYNNSEDNGISELPKMKDLNKIQGTRPPISETPMSCPICSSNVHPPLALHLRRMHPGCGIISIKGYDSTGKYLEAHPGNGPCGTIMGAFFVWYIICEKCRDAHINDAQLTRQPNRLINKLMSENNMDKRDGQNSNDEIHHFILENASFLLELVPSIESEKSPSSSDCLQDFDTKMTSRNIWKPAPKFHCLDSLGVTLFKGCNSTDTMSTKFGSLEETAQEDFVRLRSAFRKDIYRSNRHSEMYVQPATSSTSRFHRSISMDYTTPFDGGRHHHEQETYSGNVGPLSLLAAPSPALKKLLSQITKGNKLDAVAIANRPVMTFVNGKRDLNRLRHNLEGAIRLANVRQYSLESFNWLVRSVTQPTCLHDVLWWFCAAIDQYCTTETVLPDNKNKEVLIEAVHNSGPVSVSDITLSGRVGRCVRQSLHILLRSISDLMPHLPPSSPALLQAVRCWGLEYAPSDHSFLHRSQVFSVISKILSQPEEQVEGGATSNALPLESIPSPNGKEGRVWTCPDLTAWCEVQASSRQGMIGALTDGSTETFWESGDEDRSRPKWVQISCPAGILNNEKLHMMCLHIDNTRDTLNKTVSVTFTSNSSINEQTHTQECEVDSKIASWVSYTLPRNALPPIKIRCELRGPDPAVRVRQLKVLGVPVMKTTAESQAQQHSQTYTQYAKLMDKSAPTTMNVLHPYIEMETLRIFRMLTSQVFGKLLEPDKVESSTESKSAIKETETEEGEDEEEEEENDLREHVVGILFSACKLTNLQIQVMAHIVQALSREAKKTRDEWESLLVGGDLGNTPIENLGSDVDASNRQDNYCFEMLSLVLALSGSSVGRSHLAQRPELMVDLLSLLHTGSGRVQRQVILLLRRIIGEIPPQKMKVALNSIGDNSVLRLSLTDILVSYLSKAISVQVKIKDTSNDIEKNSRNLSSLVTLASGVFVPPNEFWFLRGSTTIAHAQLVAKLLSDMAEDKLGELWGDETRKTLVSYVTKLSNVSEAERNADDCVASVAFWLTCGALCVIEQSYIDRTNNGQWIEGNHTNPNKRPFCYNHDDGTTLAMIECQVCGALCVECDRFLHLSRIARTHERKICKEEEKTIRVDIHEGCGRIKLFWLFLLIDRRTNKAVAEFRSDSCGLTFNANDVRTGYGGVPGGLSGVCRYCGARGNTGLLAIGNVCAEQECQNYAVNGCTRILTCGHLCGGVKDEVVCLPCLHGCNKDIGFPILRQDADDMCMICFTDPLGCAPSIQLECGHVFHQHCLRNVLVKRWTGPRIIFTFSQCPICKEDMKHDSLNDLLGPIRELQEDVKRKALMRLDYDGAKAKQSLPSRYKGDVAAYAMDKYAYYVCYKCGKPYFGGEVRCEVELNASNLFDPSELVCGACSNIASERICPKHGADFLEYKCRYCCTVAVFFCFGTSHFCNGCHDDFQRVTNIPPTELPPCPVGPKVTSLQGIVDECPLHIDHPATGEEFALGCGVCRNTHTF